MISFIFFSIFSSLILIEGQRANFLKEKQYNNGIYFSLFTFLNDMSPEQFKALNGLIDLGVLPIAIREPVNILRNLPARVVYPNPPPNMPQLIPIVSTMINLERDEIKAILKLRYHGALINNVFHMIIKLKMLNKDQLEIIQKSLELEKISEPLDLLKNFRIFFFPFREKLKKLSESRDMPDIVKYVDKIRPFGFGYISKIISDFKLDKYVENKLIINKTEKTMYSTESLSSNSSEFDTTNSVYTTQKPNYSVSGFESLDTSFYDNIPKSSIFHFLIKCFQKFSIRFGD